MALGGIAQFIDHLNGGVHCSIKADGVITAGNIVINGAGDANARNALCCHIFAAAERTVAANDNKRINAVFTAALSSFFLAFQCLELQAACSVKNCAAAMNDTGHTAYV